MRRGMYQFRFRPVLTSQIRRIYTSLSMRLAKCRTYCAEDIIIIERTFSSHIITHIHVPPNDNDNLPPALPSFHSPANLRFPNAIPQSYAPQTRPHDTCNRLARRTRYRRASSSRPATGNKSPTCNRPSNSASACASSATSYPTCN